MAAINKVAKGDDQVYEAVDANLAAGVLVVPSNTATKSGLQGIAVAGVTAVNVLGVSQKSCVTEANLAALQAGTDAQGYPFASTAVPSPTTTVYSHGVVPLTYTAVAVGYGTRLKAAAAGAVAAWVSGTDSPAAIIGWCAQVGGVSSAGGVALVKLNI